MVRPSRVLRVATSAVMQFAASCSIHTKVVHIAFCWHLSRRWSFHVARVLPLSSHQIDRNSPQRLNLDHWRHAQEATTDCQTQMGLRSRDR